MRFTPGIRKQAGQKAGGRFLTYRPMPCIGFAIAIGHFQPQPARRATRLRKRTSGSELKLKSWPAPARVGCKIGAVAMLIPDHELIEGLQAAKCRVTRMA